MDKCTAASQVYNKLPAHHVSLTTDSYSNPQPPCITVYITVSGSKCVVLLTVHSGVQSVKSLNKLMKRVIWQDKL